MQWIPIFKTGTHTDSKGRTKEFTTADIDRLVASYNPEKHEAPVVIGHPAANLPAYAWVAGLKREGDTLYYRERQAQPEFTEMRRRGLFKKRSISIRPDGTLRHIGWLGAQPPAIKGLADVAFEEGEELFEYQEEIPESFFKEEDMDKIKELEEKLAAEKEARRQAEAEAAEYKQSADKAASEFAEAEKKRRRHEIDSFVAQGIKDGKILPGWKEQGLAAFMAALDEQEDDYEFAEGKGKQSPLQWFQGFIGSFAEHPLFKQMAPRKQDEDHDYNEGRGYEDLSAHV